MSTEQDYYQILGVDRTADQDAIKKAYRRLAMKYHPDKNPGDDAAAERFKAAATAYDVLGKPEKRAKYDRFGHAAFSGAGGGYQQAGFENMDDIFSSFSDIFGDFFGGGRRQQSRSRQRSQRGADLRYVCEIDLKDAVHGVEREVAFETEDTCGDCGGSGAKKGSQPEECRFCGGSGQVHTQRGFFAFSTPCGRCQGTGEMISDPCLTCNGSGRVRATRKVNVTIPPGVETGTQLRMPGFGEGGGRGGPTGDLFIEIGVREDPLFLRRGQDLLGIAEISYLQACLGSSIEVDTFDGKVSLTVPAGVQAGQKLKVAGKGVPGLRSRGRGDLFFEVKVRIPKSLSKSEEKALRAIAEEKGEVIAEKKGFFGF